MRVLCWIVTNGKPLSVDSAPWTRECPIGKEKKGDGSITHQNRPVPTSYRSAQIGGRKMAFITGGSNSKGRPGVTRRNSSRMYAFTIYAMILGTARVKPDGGLSEQRPCEKEAQKY